MISSKLIASRGLFRISRRTVLSAGFSLEKEWSARHGELHKLGLGGDYEWISAVQKKFIGGGTASAVDVDAALCVAQHRDQVDDVIELVYKLRHSENAADLPASGEYALIRLLLKHEPELIFKLVDDPINYGIFLNEHSACLALDHFLKRDNVQGAAYLSAWVMQQEMTENELLNLLGLYACAKWAELPVDQQTMPIPEKEEIEYGEDDMKTFRFPFLKNPHFDSHFDLVDPSHLAGKTLLWLARDSKTLTTEIKNSLRFLGAVLYNQLDVAGALASTSIQGNVAEFVRQRFTPAEGAEILPQHEEILKKLEGCETNETTLSSLVLEALETIKQKEEETLGLQQKNEFTAWNDRRNQLVRAQAEKVLLKIRAEEITKELKELENEEERMFFFENRLKWEKKANENKEIMEERAAALKA